MSHAVLSPSSASRWLNCTPSARLEKQFPDTAGEAAAEGTLAHAIGELMISFRLGIIKKVQYTKKLESFKADKLYQPEMLEYCDGYATYVVEQYNEALSHTPDARIFLEQRLNLTDYVPEGFGTGDVVIIADGQMRIIDLKYGKGVAVSAVENKQMKLYTLGALREFEHIYDISSVAMTIYQPRLNSISTFEMQVSDLKHWAETELKPKAELAFAGDGEFVPGDWCRFCKARNQCRKLAEYNLEIAKHEFKKPDLLNDEEIADILSRVDGLVKWANGVSDFALTEAVNNGKKWPGWKLVEGRSNRAWKDELQVASALVQHKVPDEDIYTKKLIGITAAESLLGKKSFQDVLGSLVIKPQGKPVLVPQTDKRPELNTAESAISDFA